MSDPLESLLRPVADILNRNIREMTPARQLAAELNGYSVAIRVRDTALAMYFVFAEDGVSLRTQATDDPDVVINGSLITLLRMLQGAGDAAIRNGSVDLSGDAAVAQRFQRLLDIAQPDLEEELSRLIGDVAAHRIAEFGHL